MDKMQFALISVMARCTSIMTQQQRICVGLENSLERQPHAQTTGSTLQVWDEGNKKMCIFMRHFPIFSPLNACFFAGAYAERSALRLAFITVPQRGDTLSYSSDFIVSAGRVSGNQTCAQLF